MALLAELHEDQTAMFDLWVAATPSTRERLAASSRTTRCGDNGSHTDEQCSARLHDPTLVMRQSAPVPGFGCEPLLSIRRTPKSTTYRARPLGSKRAAMGRSRPPLRC